MQSVEQLERVMTTPSERLTETLAQLDGDIMVLGVGGKMGPTLAMLAKNAFEKAQVSKRVIGVSRFSDENARRTLTEAGIETVSCDLLNNEELSSLPRIRNVVYMAGMKFGTQDQAYMSWAMNTYVPGKVAEHFRDSRIVVFSTGNVYPLTPVSAGGATENTIPQPIGEYAQACLGRERIFEYFSRRYNIPMLMFRLNYAIDMRYGVLLEIAQAVKNKRPINLRMGHVNVIWQGDANEAALRSFVHCSSPPAVLNVTGPETISVRKLADMFGQYFGIEPIFQDEEDALALLSDAGVMFRLFGYPTVSLHEMVHWTAQWVDRGLPTLDKPTHFQEREGKF